MRFYGSFLFTVLVAAVVMNMVFRFLEDRRNARAQRHLAREYSIIIGNILSLTRAFHVLANTWGQDPEKVRPLLQEALRNPSLPVSDIGDPD